MVWYNIVLNGSLTAGSRGIVNSLNSLSVEPRLTSGCVVFSSRLRMASVAHAFFITWTHTEVRRERGREREIEREGERGRQEEDEGREGDRGNGGEEKRNKSWRCLSFEEWKTVAHNISGGKNLLGEKYFFEPAVPDNRSLRRLLSTPLVQEDQTMDWSTQDGERHFD